MSSGGAGWLRTILLGGMLVAGCTRAGPPATPTPPSDLPPASTDRPLPPTDAPPAADRGTDGAASPGTGDALPPAGGAPATDARAVAAGPGDAPARSAELPPLRLPAEEEVRALWVVRTALLHPDSARAAVRRAADAGFNTIFVQVRGRGDAWYRSRWEPRPDPLAGQPVDYDPLGVVVAEARLRGIAVHAWVNVHLVASAHLPPTQPTHLARSRPDLLAVPRDLARDLFPVSPWDPRYFSMLAEWTRENGDRVEGIYASPAHPAVHEHVRRVIVDLLETYPLDGLHLDYIRYPSADFDYSRGALEAFREWIRTGGTGPSETVSAEASWPQDPMAYVDAFPLLWNDFRREGVTRLMRDLYLTARQVLPDLVVSAAVFAAADDAANARFQAWEEWLRAGILDAVAPMAYTTSNEIFDNQIRRAVGVAGGNRVWAGLGIYRDSFEGAIAKGRAARAAGARGIALFSYDWAVGPEGSLAGSGAWLTRFNLELGPLH